MNTALSPNRSLVEGYSPGAALLVRHGSGFNLRPDVVAAICPAYTNTKFTWIDVMPWWATHLEIRAAAAHTTATETDLALHLPDAAHSLTYGYQDRLILMLRCRIRRKSQASYRPTGSPYALASHAVLYSGDHVPTHISVPHISVQYRCCNQRDGDDGDK